MLYSRLEQASKYIDDNSYFRIARSDTAMYVGSSNSEIMDGKSTNAVHYNVLDKNLYMFNYDLQVATQIETISLRDYNERADLLATGGTKYYIAYDSQKAFVPYGFKPYKQVEGDITIYKNSNYLPLGYTYDTCIAESDYKDFSPMEKQKVLTRAVMLQDNDIRNDLKRVEMPDNITECDIALYPYDMYLLKTDESGGNYYRVKKDACLTIITNTLPNTESYLSMENINTDLVPPNIKGFDGSFLWISVNTEDGKYTPVIQESNQYRYTNHRDNMLVNIGYNEKPVRMITVTFPTNGIIYLRGIHCYSEDMSTLPEDVKHLSEEVLTDTKIGTNEITGSINVSSPKYLYLYIPYSPAWHAYIDGKEEKILRANEAYMAVKLSAGNHDVKFKYIPIFVKESVIISILAWLVFGFTALIHTLKDKTGNSLQESVLH